MVLRVLLSRRWVLLTLGFVALILVMCRLGLWQFHRYQQTNRSNHVISLAVHAAPVPLLSLTRPGAALPATDRYRPVRATGHFDPAHQFVVRRRTNTDGDIGFFLITPFVTTDGDAVLVNRGWVAPDDNDGAAFPAVPRTPGGTMTLTGRLQLDETSAVSGIRDVSGLPPRQFMLISSREQAKALPEPVVSGYMELVGASPALGRAASAQLVPPPGSGNSSDAAIVGQGVHLPYAIQWWLFALMVPVGWFILLRQELRERRKKAAEDAEAGSAEDTEAAAAEPAVPAAGQVAGPRS